MRERSEFELFSKLSIGQYIPTGSVIHRLDPRIKLILGILLIATAVLAGSVVAILILLSSVILGLCLTRVQLRLAFTPLKFMLFFLFILAVIQVFTIPQYRTDGTVLLHRGVVKVTTLSLLSGTLLIFRFVVIVLGLSMFSFSTSTTELLHGIEHLLRPLERIGFPAHELALTVHISIRFLPILAGEAEQLMKAQASRGADFGYSKWNFFRKIRKMLPLLLPLFIVSLKHAQHMARAMESRCYTGGAGRSHFVRLHTGPSDYSALLFGCAVSASALLVYYLAVDEAVGRLLLNILRM